MFIFWISEAFAIKVSSFSMSEREQHKAFMFYASCDKNCIKMNAWHFSPTARHLTDPASPWFHFDSTSARPSLAGHFLKCVFVCLRAKQVCALPNLRQCDLRNAFMHGFWWMLREVGMLQQRKSNQTIMICRFSGNFFHYVFGVVLGVEERPVERQNVNKNAIKGVNKRTFFVVFLSL